MSIKINQGKPCHAANYSSRNGSKIEYIVIHYTAGNGDTAQGNCNYFSSGSRGASAHYFVGEDGIYQSVQDNLRAWHCGGTSTYKHPKCRNANSIGIEMCSRKNSSGEYYIVDKVVSQTIGLTQHLMKKYNIPISNVLRHFDVWPKACPAPFVKNEILWKSFKNAVANTSTEVQMPAHWAEPFLNKLIQKGYISDKTSWSNYDSFVSRAQAVALIDKTTGGMWTSNEDDASVHWAQPHVISLCGKKIIEDKSQWLMGLDTNITKALFLALIDKATGGTKVKYVDRVSDHWGRNNLDSLCDKGIITTPESWTDFDSALTKGLAMGLVCKAFIG